MTIGNQNKYHCEQLIFVPHQGKLFCADNKLDAATIIKEVKASEALKVIPKTNLTLTTKRPFYGKIKYAGDRFNNNIWNII